MYLVAIAWIYVVLMMAVAEAMASNGTVLGAVITFVLYGVLPLSVVMYLMATPMRRRARQAADAAQDLAQAPAQDAAQDGAQLSSPPLPQSVAQSVTQPRPANSTAEPPDGSGHAPGDAVAPERKEV